MILLGRISRCEIFTKKESDAPLGLGNSSLNIHGENIPVDPALLFQGILLAKKSDEQLKQYFDLALYPLSLFDERGMRKTKISSLYDFFYSLGNNLQFKNYIHVIKGGYIYLSSSSMASNGDVRANHQQVCGISHKTL